jgi:hypothetical protein
MGEELKKLAYHPILPLTLAGIALLPARAWACSCTSPAPVDRAVQDSRAVFAGRVMAIRDRLTLPKEGWRIVRFAAAALFDAPEPDDSPREYGLEVELAVDRVWKGVLPQTATVLTGRGGGDCGYPFRIGESYLVYLYPYDERWEDTSICSRTRRLSAAAGDLALLGAPTAPVDLDR